jgi:predicted short-subunit dehydrogenase-like oxidoreductase (DUF2520 family)
MHGHDLHQRADSDPDPTGHRFGSLKPTLAFVGAGKVGATLARLLVARGYVVTSVYSRSYSHADELARQVGARAVESPRDLTGDLAILAVPDDAIEAAAQALAGFDGMAAVHTSGARDAGALAALAGQGITVGSLHPAYPFADVETSIAGLPGAAFAVEAENARLMDWLRGIVAALDGRVLLIPPGGKALYHAALCIASNYAVTLYALAERLLASLGADKSAADAALNVLLGGTVENLRARGVPRALTGPLVRSDVGTIAGHLAALNAADPQIADAYRALARLTYPLLVARGIAPESIELLLRQDEEHAHHRA